MNDTTTSTREAELLAALAWIVTFCDEHPEWFGDDPQERGAENEWLDHARQLVWPR